MTTTAAHNGIHGAMVNAKTKTRPDRVARAEVMQRAAQLRAAGASFREIGEALGINHSTARTYVLKVLANTEFEGAELMRLQEGQRLDRLQRAHWQQALAGDVRATRLVLQIIDRRAKLFGLDAPVKFQADVNLTTSDIDAEVAALARQLEGLPSSTPKE